MKLNLIQSGLSWCLIIENVWGEKRVRGASVQSVHTHRWELFMTCSCDTSSDILETISCIEVSATQEKRQKSKGSQEKVSGNKGKEIHLIMNSTKLIIPLHFISWQKDSKGCCDTTMPESIHTKDETKRGSAFAFIFGVNWPVQWM